MKHPITNAAHVDTLAFDTDGLVPVVAQDETTGAVLMLAWANRDALVQSLETGRMTYWSRSRGALWEKGETSGHTQRLVSLAADCDRDAILATVQQNGPACHEATGSCWSTEPDLPVSSVLGLLDHLAAGRMAQPAGGYTDQLLADGHLAASKVVEEANEVAAVLRGDDNDDTLEHEAADLLYHLVVALRGADRSLAAVLQELAKRHK